MAQSTFFLLTTVVTLFVCLHETHYSAQTDTEAMVQCRSIDHVDVEQFGTQYLNNKCQLNCVVHGKLTRHYLNEGSPCPTDKTGLCKSGKCEVHTGFIDVEISSASMAEPKNPYVNVCIRNTSEPVTFPIQQNSCTFCATDIKDNTTYPVWNKVCTTTSNIIFSGQSRVVFELGDHHTPTDNFLVGDAELTIAELLNENNSHKELHLALNNSKIAAQVNVRVTWTPRS